MANLTRRGFITSAVALGAAAGAGQFPRPAIAASTIKVGADLPFSGGLELFGAQGRIGLNLAAAEINAGGGILGHKVELIYEDNRTDPKTATEKARKLIERDEAIAVCGPITSQSAIGDKRGLWTTVLAAAI